VNMFVARLTLLAPLLTRSVSVIFLGLGEIVSMVGVAFVRPFLRVRLYTLDMSNGRANVENGVNVGYNFVNILFGYLNVIV